MLSEEAQEQKAQARLGKTSPVSHHLRDQAEQDFLTTFEFYSYSDLGLGRVHRA